MATPAEPGGPVRFGAFELDLRSGELRKSGLRVKLQAQPIQVLAMLVERPGEVVTREELRQKLWPADTFVDFDTGLNTAIKKLRSALGDSAETPRFIETLPRRGYRLLCPVSVPETAGSPPASQDWWRGRRAKGGIVGMACLAAVVVLFAANVAGWRDRVLRRPANGEITSLAVLPLRNLTGDLEQDYLAGATTENLITALGRAGKPRILSHQSVLQFSQSDRNLQEIARELNVDAIIEGRLLRTQNGFRITINFVQAEPERHLFAETYDRKPGEVLMLPDDVAADVLRRIGAKLSPDQQRQLGKSRPVDPEVYAAYAKGLHHLLRGTNKDRAQAHEFFTQAVEKDPNFAPAYAGMALLDAHGGTYRGVAATPEFREQARQWALKALALDDGLAEAHTALAWIEFFFDWNFAAAEQEFRRAIELNPNYATARIYYLSYLAAMRRTTEGDAQAEAVLRIEPASVTVLSHVALHYLCSGRVNRAIELTRQALDLEPDYFAAHWFLGRAYLAKEMYPQAIVELEQATALAGSDPFNQGLLAYAYLRAGRRQDAQRLVAELDQQKGVYLAVAHFALGNKDKAFELLERGYQRHRGASKRGEVPGAYLVMLNADPLFETLRDDPRFHDLVRRIGLPEVPVNVRK